jgi:hypothetical protein
MRPVRSLTLLSVTLALLAAGCGGYGTRLQLGQGELYYTSAVTADEAQKVGQYLRQRGEFDLPRSIQLHKSAGTYQLRLVIAAEYRGNDGVAQVQAMLGGRVSHYALGGAPVTVQLCDEHLKTYKEMPSLTVVPSANGTLFVKPGTNLDDARRLADKLPQERLFAGAGWDVYMEAFEQGYEVAIILVTPGVENDPQVERDLRDFRARTSREVFAGRPVRLRVCDAKMHTLRVLEAN